MEEGTSGRQVRFIRVEMNDEMQQRAVVKLNEGMDKHTVEKDIASFVKKAFDEEFGSTWHCVVGRNFGCSVTHDTKYLVFLQIDQTYALIFKSLE